MNDPAWTGEVANLANSPTRPRRVTLRPVDQHPVPTDDWWPSVFGDIATARPFEDDPVVVAEISATAAEADSYWQVFTALAPMTNLSQLLDHPGGIGAHVEASGPHPSSLRGQWGYEPRFWISGGSTAAGELEPLVVSWVDANRTVLWPDQGFLMTYGLSPRLVRDYSSERMHWDASSEPRADVVVVQPISTHNWGAHSGARVTVVRDVLQDYATVRGLALVQVFYAQRSGPRTSDVGVVLGSEEIVEHRLKGRLFDIRRIDDEDRVLLQVWGVRLLTTPGEAPVSAGRWDYGTLSWPGRTAPVTKELTRQLGMSGIEYVRDTVLAKYEGQPGFEIYPESGSVQYGGQWSVSSTKRVGRDLIAVDLKKLYEGNHPATVRHWNAHAVPPPARGPESPKEANVGSRSRRIVYALVALGEALSELAAALISQPHDANAFVRQNRAELDYAGWWRGPRVEPVTRHVPFEIGRDAFLARCNDLNKLVNEGIQQAPLRRLLQALGVPLDQLKDLGSIRLLDRVVQLGDVAMDVGLGLSKYGSELYARLSQGAPPSRVGRLAALNSMRQLADHPVDQSFPVRLQEALARFGLDSQGQSSGWGLALDKVYDGTAETLEEITRALARSPR